MVFKLTIKNCEVSISSYKNIEKYLDKIERFFPNVKGDLIVLRLVIKKNIDKYYPVTSPRNKANSKPGLAYFDGSVSFILNKKHFYTHVKGQTSDECIHRGFDLILGEIKKFKDFHFSSRSDYPGHNSIKNVAFG